MATLTRVDGVARGCLALCSGAAAADGVRYRARMSRASAAWLVAILVWCQEARTSDKGIGSELVESAVGVFCETTIAKDMAPLLSLQKQLARSKVSPEALARAHREMDAAWALVAEKHKEAFARWSLGGRLASLEVTWVDDAAQRAHAEIARRCKRKPPAEAVREVLRRRVRDLSTARTPEPDAGPSSAP